MKVLLLIVAIYALIFNQASKKIAVNNPVEERKMGTDEQTLYPYMHQNPHAVPVTHEYPMKHFSGKDENLSAPQSHATMFYPVYYYSNTLNTERKRS